MIGEQLWNSLRLALHSKGFPDPTWPQPALHPQAGYAVPLWWEHLALAGGTELETAFCPERVTCVGGLWALGSLGGVRLEVRQGERMMIVNEEAALLGGPRVSAERGFLVAPELYLVVRAKNESDEPRDVFVLLLGWDVSHEGWLERQAAEVSRQKVMGTLAKLQPDWQAIEKAARAARKR